MSEAGSPYRRAAATHQAAWGSPAFAEDFPEDEELARLVAAFAAGDYAAVRAGAPALARSTGDEDVKQAALLLRARIEPDPASRVFFVVTAALLLFLFGYWATHDGAHPPPRPPPKAPPIEFVN
jgi:hypothetical protein